MKSKRRESLFSILLDTGLQLVDELRERLPDDIGDVRGRVRDTYDTASERARRAADALLGKEDCKYSAKSGHC